MTKISDNLDDDFEAVNDDDVESGNTMMQMQDPSPLFIMGDKRPTVLEAEIKDPAVTVYELNFS